MVPQPLHQPGLLRHLVPRRNLRDGGTLHDARQSPPLLRHPHGPLHPASLQPAQRESTGQEVAPFDEAVWTAERENIVREGNLLKFRAHPDLRAALLATGDRELAEASPRDRVWGIGYSPDKAPHTNRSAWGLNLLGKVLMQVREELRREEETGEETGEGKAKEDEGKKTTAEA
ncbi:N-glycosidase [Colletotrichum trifolii]|uniref:N-glycosidase n=1 Tax=Colletotrichum trifolii TaxID=5466 RepID=A0A4R8RTE7_COLTR|nr:N-glycosidase [Colletotrichum trifolii]